MSFPINVILRWTRLQRKMQCSVIHTPLQKQGLCSDYCFRLCVKFKIVLEHFPQLCHSIVNVYVEENLVMGTLAEKDATFGYARSALKTMAAFRSLLLNMSQVYSNVHGCFKVF